MSLNFRRNGSYNCYNESFKMRMSNVNIDISYFLEGDALRFTKIWVSARNWGCFQDLEPHQFPFMDDLTLHGMIPKLEIRGVSSFWVHTTIKLDWSSKNRTIVFWCIYRTGQSHIKHYKVLKTLTLVPDLDVWRTNAGSSEALQTKHGLLCFQKKGTPFHPLEFLILFHQFPL